MLLHESGDRETRSDDNGMRNTCRILEVSVWRCCWVVRDLFVDWKVWVQWAGRSQHDQALLGLHREGGYSVRHSPRALGSRRNSGSSRVSFFLDLFFQWYLERELENSGQLYQTLLSAFIIFFSRFISVLKPMIFFFVWNSEILEFLDRESMRWTCSLALMSHFQTSFTEHGFLGVQGKDGEK